LKRIVVTGADGFIGKNLIRRLEDIGLLETEVISLTRESSNEEWEEAIECANCIIHLAGVNRSDSDNDFIYGNVDSTKRICNLVSDRAGSPRIFFASSTKAVSGTPYGDTKIAAENAFNDLAKKNGGCINICRLPNVYGKWSKPFYNSVVATFCHQIANNQEVEIHNKSTLLELLYIDDLVDALVNWLESPGYDIDGHVNKCIDQLTLGSLAERLIKMRDSRAVGVIPSAGFGLDRKLYATLLSFMPVESAVTLYHSHTDPRGSFSELFKHSVSGQVAFLTSKPGVVRGEHFHNTKVERFVVLAGHAKLEYRHVIDHTYFAVVSSAGDGKIIETLPGYAHNITNIGEEDLIVVLWANEVFDDSNPDTYYSEVNKIET
jgi:UDP-2-acetamido-2,6-beta-L-arabino-hexul-4-ose reductase